MGVEFFHRLVDDLRVGIDIAVVVDQLERVDGVFFAFDARAQLRIVFKSFFKFRAFFVVELAVKPRGDLQLCFVERSCVEIVVKGVWILFVDEFKRIEIGVGNIGREVWFRVDTALLASSR